MSEAEEAMLIQRARALRKDNTDAEKRLWTKLRNRRLLGMCFRRQQPLCGYILDFVCFERKLIIELDGGQHGEDREQAYDVKRTQELNKHGYQVVRFWNNEVLENIEGVLSKIALTINAPHPYPFPQGAREEEG
jgi:very-short-patch-repair endonuclease